MSKARYRQTAAQAQTKVFAACLVGDGHWHYRGSARVRVDGVSYPVRQLVVEWDQRDVPPGFVAVTTCGFARCIRPDHLDVVAKSDVDRSNRVR